MKAKLLNVANSVTLVRILLIPFFMALLLSRLAYGQWIALGIFVIAALTDGLDGYLARSNNQVTNLGKILDPLADKMIISAALISLVELRELSSWIAVIIISREFAVSALRIATASKDVIIPASMLGKTKTVFQIIAISFWIVKVEASFVWLNIVSWIIMLIAVALTIISGFDYFIRLRKYLE